MSDEIFRIHLEQLEEDVRVEGEDGLADLIQQIRSLPNPVAFLRRSLAPRKGRKRHDSSYHERVAWFTSYRSQDDAALSEKEMRSLVSLTSCWDLELFEVQTLQTVALLWCRCPYIFWEGEHHNNNIVLRAFNDLRNDPIRRKVILTTLSEYIEEQQTNTLREPWEREISHVTNVLWPFAKDDEKKKNKHRLSDFSLRGWKWRQLEHPGFMLSISDTPYTWYEKVTWTKLQRHALNSWIKTTNQFRIIDILDGTWKSITNWYIYGSKTDNRQAILLNTRGRCHTINEQRDFHSHDDLGYTLPPLRHTSFPILPLVPCSIPLESSAIPRHHDGTTRLPAADQREGVRPVCHIDYRLQSVDEIPGDSSASSITNSNTEEEANDQQNFTDETEQDELEPPHPKRRCAQRQIQVAATEPALVQSVMSDNQSHDGELSGVTSLLHIQASLVNRTDVFEPPEITEPERPQQQLCLDENTSQISNRSLMPSQPLPQLTWSGNTSPQAPHYHDGTHFPTSTGQVGAIQVSHQRLARSRWSHLSEYPTLVNQPAVREVSGSYISSNRLPDTLDEQSSRSATFQQLPNPKQLSDAVEQQRIQIPAVVQEGYNVNQAYTQRPNTNGFGNHNLSRTNQSAFQTSSTVAYNDNYQMNPNASFSQSQRSVLATMEYPDIHPSDYWWQQSIPCDSSMSIYPDIYPDDYCSPLSSSSNYPDIIPQHAWSQFPSSYRVPDIHPEVYWNQVYGIS